MQPSPPSRIDYLVLQKQSNLIELSGPNCAAVCQRIASSCPKINKQTDTVCMALNSSENRCRAYLREHGKERQCRRWQSGKFLKFVRPSKRTVCRNGPFSLVRPRQMVVRWRDFLPNPFSFHFSCISPAFFSSACHGHISIQARVARYLRGPR